MTRLRHRLLAGSAVLFLVATLASLSLAADREDAAPEPVVFRKLARPSVPRTAGDWGRNPIDRFVLAALEAKGLKPSPEADRATLLKRVCHDLTGLPPTPEIRDAFLSDNSPGAYERLVDRLLASQHYGERMAQHWLDLVRYSETEGFKVDRYRPDAWRYRDYVIRAFNDDRPYDRFVQEQLAGDELDPENAEAVLATGFLRLHPEESNGANYRQIRQDIMDDVTETTGLAFLGLTLGCARCHDHKTDPIAQVDYFEFQAFFVGMIPDDDVPLVRGADASDYREKMRPWETATAAIRKEMEGLLAPVGKQVFDESVVALDEETQTALKTPMAQRTPMQMQLALYGGKQIFRKHEKMHRRLQGDQKARFDALKVELAKFDAMKPAPMPTAMAVREASATPPKTYRLGGGDIKRQKQEVQPAVLDCLDKRPIAISAPTTRPESSGRRLALAKWLTEPDHPLTSRVMANRVWQQHFGRGIVATPSDFGGQGQKPTHPELLDWLASELVARDWSVKALHRLVVTSAAYRQASRIDGNPTAAVASKVDPENRLWWHAPVRRRDAEAIRDASLAASGALNSRMFGDSACPELPPAILNSSRAWYPDEKVPDRNRRSVYVFNRRNLTYPLFAAFDAPNRSLSCASRNVTVSANQALLMLNGEFALEQSRILAGSVASKTDDLPTFVAEVYRRVLGREATPEDRSRAEAFVRAQAARLANEVPACLPEPMRPGMTPAQGAALVDLCHALLASAEFLTIE